MFNHETPGINRLRATIGLALAVSTLAQGVAAAKPASAPVQAPTAITWTRGVCRADDACVVADGAVSRGPAELRSQGFLHGVTATTDVNLLRALKPQHWRLSDHNMYDLLRRQTSARITWIISDSWQGTTCTDGSAKCPLPPWDDWEKYEAYVRALVTWAIQSGRPMDYWDIINEPGWGAADGTPAQYLELLHRAHDAIRSVDPDAKISAPSLVAFDPPSGTDLLDIESFVKYAAAKKLHFDAISWHENMATSPRDISEHVSRARALLAKHAELGNVELHVGEYTPPDTRRIPGWAVGWLAALEESDVDAAFRACWWEQDPGQSSHSGCWPGVLDGLLMGDERTTRPVYWAYKAYADMTGARLGTSTSDRTVSIFATDDKAKKEARILIGRHELCTPATNPDCYATEVASPRSVGVRIRLPWKGAARAHIAKIPNQPGALSAPVTVATVEGPPNGWSTIRLPSVADGEAYMITVRPTP